MPITPQFIARGLAAMLLLAYPLAWGQIIYPVNGFQFLPLFPPTVIALAALAAICCGYNRIRANRHAARYILLLSGILLLLVPIHMLTAPTPSWGQYLPALLAGTLPLCCYFYAAELAVLLVPLMTLTWIMAVLVSLREYFLPPYRMYGVPGNYNWNATLIAVTGIFVLYALYRKTERCRRWRRLAIMAVPGLISLAIIYGCGSRGTWVGLGAALLLVVMVKWRRYRPWVLGLAAAAGIAAYATLLFFPTQLEHYFGDDVRIFLWQGDSALIRDHWLIGTSPARFENTFAAYIPEKYYLGRFTAARH
ncbi:MAG: O-antigen ligase family protein, partial [Victivallales bacterium]|nr:O-antigen ligase family protein [Victivallales bacterium]